MAENPNPARITGALWWFAQQCLALEPTSRNGGIYAVKSGYHNTGRWNLDNRRDDYSVRYPVDRSGPWWESKAAAFDWTFPPAQAGDYSTISRYCGRLLAASRAGDPRLWGWREWYGQADADSAVEGWDILRGVPVSSDATHRWHEHASVLRLYVGDRVVMEGKLSVLAGESLGGYRARGGRLLARAPRPEDTVHVGYADGGDGMGYGTVRAGAQGDAARWVQDQVLLFDPHALDDVGGRDGVYGPGTAAAVARLFGGDGSVFGPDQYRRLRQLLDERYAAAAGPVDVDAVAAAVVARLAVDVDVDAPQARARVSVRG